MKKLFVSFICILFILALIGCSKISKEPQLNLKYDGRTYMTLLIEYQDNNTKNKLQGDYGTSYLKIKQHSKLEFVSTKSIDKCTLLIQKAETKEKVKEQTLNYDTVDTNIPPGKYIYTFSTKWEGGSAKFIEMVEIE